MFAPSAVNNETATRKVVIVHVLDQKGEDVAQQVKLPVQLQQSLVYAFKSQYGWAQSVVGAWIVLTFLWG